MSIEPTAPATFAGLSLDRTRLMGVVNATPDSFSDGGEAFAAIDAIALGRRLAEEGADIVDVGGESTRPGSAPIDAEQEKSRVLPVIEALAGDGILVSIDSRRAEVMAAALQAGARIVNDVTALDGDPGSLGVVAASEASVVLMHMQGEPGTMQDDPRYDDAAREVRGYLGERVAACEAAGIAKDRVAVDPGIGFGKNLDHNLQILARLEAYEDLGCGLVLGVSRKSFIHKLSGVEDPKRRLPGSLAAALAGIERGVQILRVHDVAATRQALDMWEAIGAAGR